MEEAVGARCETLVFGMIISMDKHHEKGRQKIFATRAGQSLLVMAILAGYANFGILKNNGSPLAAGSIFIFVAFLDVMAAYYLHKLFFQTDKKISTAAMYSRMIYAVIFAAAAVVLMFGNVDKFNMIWQGSLLIFAVHLLLLGLLLLKAVFAPKWLSVLVIIAAAGYAIDSLGTLLVPDYRLEIAGFTFIGEVALLFWLLWLGASRTSTTGQAKP